MLVLVPLVILALRADRSEEKLPLVVVELVIVAFVAPMLVEVLLANDRLVPEMLVVVAFV